MKPLEFLSGGGEMGAVMRAFDWPATPLGPAESWPQSLKTTLATLLRSKLPMLLWWGPDLTGFYNDAFRPALGDGGRHPSLLGQPVRAAWPEIWEKTGPQIEFVLEKGEGSWNEDLAMPIFRNGQMEEAYWTFGYSPVLLDNGGIGGILVTGIETTAKVKTQELLREKAQQLTTVIDSADLGTWDSDLRTGVQIHNLKLKQFFGFAEHEKPGTAEFLSRINEKDRNRLIQTMEESSQPGSSGEFDMEYTIGGAAGDRHVRAKGKTFFDENGNPVRFTGTLQDVTQKNLTMMALEASQQELLELFEEAPVAITTISGDEQLRFLTANQFYRELVGRRPSELIGKPLLEALPELNGQGFDQLLKEVVTSGVPYTAYEVPVQLNRGNGIETVYVNFSYIPRRNTKRNATGILVTATDVSFQVKARRAIEENEALFRTLIEAAPFPIGVYMGEGLRIQYANPAIVKVYGKGDDVIGKGYLELLPELEQQGIGGQIREVLATGRAYHSDTRRVDIEVGNTTVSYYFNYSFTPLFDTGGKVIGILNTGIDVTELELARQRAEEAEVSLRSAVELAELADWSIDITNGMMDLSARLKEWMGANADTIPVDDFFAQIPEDHRPAIAGAYRREFLSAENSPLDLEHGLRQGDHGHTRFIHVRGQLVRDGAQTAVRLTGTMQDITAQRALQWELERQVAERTAELAGLNAALQSANRQLERKNEELKYSNDELTQYAYVTSHDLQEPLRKIRVFASALMERFTLPPGAELLLQKMNKSATRMTQLIQDLLAFSRLIGTDEIMQAVNLAGVVSSVLDDFELALEEKKGTVEVSGLPVINGVALQMNQLFYNLIGNAIKFSAPGRAPLIRISARIIHRDELMGMLPPTHHERWHEVRVQDNGIGFEQEFADYIFEPFKQLHSRDSFPGSGIGLALCRRIVANHGGHIYAMGTLGEGSCFIVLLPA